MPTVTVNPSGIAFDADTDQTVMAAALAAGYRWPTVCGGQGDCLVCHIEVLEGSEHLSAASPQETHSLRDLAGGHGGRGDQVRLACQAQVRGDVVVLKRGVRGRRTRTEGEATGADG